MAATPIKPDVGVTDKGSEFVLTYEADERLRFDIQLVSYGDRGTKVVFRGTGASGAEYLHESDYIPEKIAKNLIKGEPKQEREYIKVSLKKKERTMPGISDYFHN